MTCPECGAPMNVEPNASVDALFLRGGYNNERGAAPLRVRRVKRVALCSGCECVVVLPAPGAPLSRVG